MLESLYGSLRDIVGSILLIVTVTPITGLLISLLPENSRLRAIERKLWLAARNVGRCRASSLIAIAAISLTISAVLSFERPPKPTNMDEFSYLLAADTFAHGRLTNPTPPFWIHFESLHIIMKPTYASKYAPGPGLMLALGQIIWRPIVGAWISTALACTAIYWMLLVWVPARWAVVGGLIALSHPLLLTWGQSFSGASAAACGGALIIASWGRLLKGTSVLDVVLFSLGSTMLAFTRPFEGLVLTALVLVALTGRAVRHRHLVLFIKRVLLPITLISLLPLGWLAYYHWRVTGNPLRMPYMVHEATYGIAPTFLFQEVRPEPHYNFEEIRSFHRGFELQWYVEQQSARNLPLYIGYKLALFLVLNSMNLLLAIPLVAIPALKWKRSKIGSALLVLALFITAEMSVSWLNAHYASVVLGLYLLICVTGLRILNLWIAGNKKVGAGIVSMVLLVSFATLPSRFAHPAALTTGDTQYGYKRDSIAENLKAIGNDHLVFVRYGPNHDIREEWVYNDADIDGSRIVWAREVSPAADQLLLEYYKSRKAWVLEVDTESPEPRPYDFGIAK